MIRLPVITNRPPCYGISHVRDDVECAECAHRARCAEECQHWESKPSLLQQIVEAEDQIARPRDITDTFRRLHVRLLGRTNFQVTGPKFQDALVRVQRLCDRREIDPAMYIEAQIEGMRWWMENTPIGRRAGFCANHLLGGKSEQRYDEFIRRGNRLRNHARHSSITGDAAYQGLRCRVMDVDAEYGRGMVIACRDGACPGAVGTPRDAEWQEAFGGDCSASSRRRGLRGKYGQEFLRLLGQLCHLEAISAVAEWVRPGLSSHIYLPDTIAAWSSVAPLLATYCATHRDEWLSDEVRKLCWQPARHRP